MFAKAGIALGLRNGWRSLAIAAVAGTGFGIIMATADLTVFAAAVPASQKALFAAPDLPFIGALVLYDELVLRLIGMTALTLLVMAVTGRRGAAVHWAAIALTAMVLWPLSARGYLVQLDWSALTAAREVTLHGGAGLVWGWLCWRHGWLAGLIGHLSAYAGLIPLLSP